MTSCTFTGNACRPEINYDGGAIASSRDLGDTTPAALTILNSTFTGNHADSFGGAISADTYTTVIITGCTFTNNTAKGGGAIDLGSNVAALSNCTFTGNQAQDSGGAIVTSGYPGTTTTIKGCTFTGNSAGNSDGDSYSGGDAALSNGDDNTKPAVLTIGGQATIAGNTAASGGGVYSRNAGNTLTVTTGTVTGNTPDNCAGTGISC